MLTHWPMTVAQAAPPDPHGGASEKTEDHDRVQDQVGQGSGHQNGHGKACSARCLEKTLEDHTDQISQTKSHADPQVRGALGGDPGVVRKNLCQPSRKGKARCRKEKSPGGGKGKACLGDPGGFLILFHAKGPGQDGIYAHRRSHTGRDHQHLDRAGQGSSRQGILPQPCHKNRVHNVIKGLDQKGDHHGQGHGPYQRPHGPGLHPVSAFFFFHTYLFSAVKNSVKEGESTPRFHAVSSRLCICMFFCVFRAFPRLILFLLSALS